MSRSFKKNSIIKDMNKSAKVLGNKLMRKKLSKNINFEEDDLILPIDKSEVVNDYDVTDYKFFIDQKTDEHYIEHGLKPLRKGKNKKLPK